MWKNDFTLFIRMVLYNLPVRMYKTVLVLLLLNFRDNVVGSLWSIKEELLAVGWIYFQVFIDEGSPKIAFN